MKPKQQKEKDNGYKYATTNLLKGRLPAELRSFVCFAYQIGDYSSFDKGIEQTPKDWETGEET